MSAITLAIILAYSFVGTSAWWATDSALVYVGVCLIGVLIGWWRGRADHP